LDLLTGPGTTDLLQAAVATNGGHLLSWTAREVDHRPGASTTVSYRARVALPDGERAITLGASTGLRTVRSETPGMLVLSDGNQQVAVWRFPGDPGLPGLATALDESAVRALLSSFGLQAGRLDLRLRAYRPRRRAVVEITGPGVRLFVKVVRPSKVADLHRRHRLLYEAGVPVPRSLGWTDDGLLVLAALPGDDLRNVLRDGARGAPEPGDILSMLDRLPTTVSDLPSRPSWTDNVEHYAAILGSTLPHEAERASCLANHVAQGLVGACAGNDPTHGDLYEAQILLEGGRITGLLDVDTAGPGRRADDLACLIAHLDLLAHIEQEHSPTTTELNARMVAAFDRRIDPVELRLRVAGVLMSLATGPHRVQEPGWAAATSARLDLVQQWLDVPR
jgi:hypothetical protein